MKLILFIIGMFCISMANAQVAPGGELKNNYINELKSFEMLLKQGKQMEAEKSFQTLIQIQQRHKKKLEGMLANATDNEEKTEIANRIEDDGERLERLKELGNDMAGNREDIIEEINSFLEE